MARVRRPWGLLRATVLSALEESGRPTSARDIHEFVDSALAVPPSVVFRAIRGLIEEGAIRKVVTARAYVIGGCDRSVDLYCRGCGTLRQISCTPAFAKLDATAQAAGFTISHHFVEVSGLCWRCASATENSPRAAGEVMPRRGEPP